MCAGFVRWQLKDGLSFDDRELIRVWNAQFLGMLLRINSKDMSWTPEQVTFPHHTYHDSVKVRNQLPKTDPEELKAAYARKAAAEEARRRQKEQTENKPEL